MTRWDVTGSHTNASHPYVVNSATPMQTCAKSCLQDSRCTFFVMFMDASITKCANKYDPFNGTESGTGNANYMEYVCFMVNRNDTLVYSFPPPAMSPPPPLAGQCVTYGGAWGQERAGCMQWVHGCGAAMWHVEQLVVAWGCHECGILNMVFSMPRAK